MRKNEPISQVDEETAIKLYKSGWWVNLNARHIVAFQLFQGRLCMPFGVFHEALETSLGRPVYTHEIGLNHEGIKKERSAPGYAGRNHGAVAGRQDDCCIDAGG